MTYDEMLEIKAENDKIISEYERLRDEFYEEISTPATNYNLGGENYRSSQQMAAEEYARNYTAAMEKMS